MFTKEKLKNAAVRIKTKKAPGPDQIPPKLIRYIAENFPDDCLLLMNQQLLIGEFPSLKIFSKRARLVLLEKPSKSEQQAPSFRPLCLLDCMGKLLEHLLKDRINEELNQKGGLAKTQYGFTKGSSTIDAISSVLQESKRASWAFASQNRKQCLLVTIDVKNAFNSAPWEGIVKALKKRKFHRI